MVPPKLLPAKRAGLNSQAPKGSKHLVGPHVQLCPFVDVPRTKKMGVLNGGTVEIGMVELWKFH